MSTPYSDAFFVGQRDISSTSAGVIVPIVLSLVPAKSVIDVGCGVGTWSARFLEHGVSDLVAVDGDYVNRALLKIPPACFFAHDLRQPISFQRRFDLAICLEVAEHLPSSRAESLVGDLCRLAPVVFFSAALPGQGGTDHINEQYLSYWVRLFAANGYVLLDAIRGKIWQEHQCDWVYRQNAVLFAERTHPIAGRLQFTTGVDYVHPFLLEWATEKVNRPTVSYLLRSLPASIGRSLSTRWRRTVRSKGR